MQQAARVHALLGNGDYCDRCLDAATVLADRTAARPGGEPPWVYFFSPDYLVMQRGKAYRYLGRYQQAEEFLAADLAALPHEGNRLIHSERVHSERALVLHRARVPRCRDVSADSVRHVRLS